MIRLRITPPMFVAAFAGVVMLPHHSVAQCSPRQVAKLLATDGAGGGFFGQAVDISGDLAIVGAHGDDERGEDSGSASIFRRASGTWTPVQKLVPDDGAAFDQFGFAVAIDGNTAIVGAWGDEEEVGSAYIYREDANGVWNLIQKISPGGSPAGAEFGYSVDLHGRLAIVGAPGENAFTGAAYVFRDNGSGQWQQEARLSFIDSAESDWFGHTVVVSRDSAGEVALIGAVLDDNFIGVDAGSVYVFREDAGWVPVDIIVAPDGGPGDRFGHSISHHGEIAVIGAPLHDNANGEDAGSAYVFGDEAGLWPLIATFRAADGRPGDWFGHDVALDGNSILVGQPTADFGTDEIGAAYLFRNDGEDWAPERQITANDGAPGDAFGYAVALDGDNALIGGWTDDDNGPDAGAAYAFDLNCEGRFALSVLGECPGRMSFQTDNATPGGRVAFVYGFGQGSVAVPPGLPCAGTVLGLNGTARLGGTAVADADGAATFDANVPANACGRVLAQAIDLQTCATTNVVGF